VHVHLERLDRRLRRLGTPEHVHESLSRHDRVRVQKQVGQ
jgi:hypothetical protein